jgi:hypothetical protein
MPEPSRRGVGVARAELRLDTEGQEHLWYLLILREPRIPCSHFELVTRCPSCRGVS